MRGAIGASIAVLVLAVTGCGGPSGGSEEARGARGEDLSWSYDRVLDGSASLGDMAVVAEDDIWASGVRQDTAWGRRQLFLLRYDGEDWREQPTPAGIGGDAQDIRLDAVGSGEVWLTASSGYGAGEQTRIARWDGTSWTSLGSVPNGRVVDLKAFAPDDVWALVGANEAAHWDGTRWTTTRPPAHGLASLDGTAPDDLWAVGYRDTGGGDDERAGETEYTQPAAVHWDGRTWKAVETPEYHFPEPVPPEPGASLSLVVALAADDVRAYGSHTFNHGEGGDEPDDEAVRIRWDGRAWVRQEAAAGECAERVPVLGDGAKGMFLDGNRYLAADGTCVKITRSRLPNEGGVRADSRQSLWLDELARLPGTDRVIGVGHVQVNQSGNPMSKAVVVSLREG